MLGVPVCSDGLECNLGGLLYANNYGGLREIIGEGARCFLFKYSWEFRLFLVGLLVILILC